jgi:AcrR family transcriptional regulator
MGEKSAAKSAHTSSSQRLHAALAAMLKPHASGESAPALTAKALCELAGISRNALYRYHPDVLQALRAAQQQHRQRPDPTKRVVHQLRHDNAALHEQLTKLAALVDHYFAAWQESRLLLQRRDRELAALRRDTKPRVVSIRSRPLSE